MDVSLGYCNRKLFHIETFREGPSWIDVYCRTFQSHHALVLSDADIDYTTDQLISAAFGSSGQRCMALSVAVVFSDVKEKFLENLEKKVIKLKFGLDDLNSNSFGP